MCYPVTKGSVVQLEGQLQKKGTGATAENRVFSVLQEADRLGSGPKNVFARVCVRGGDGLKQDAKAVPLFGLKPETAVLLEAA